MASVAAATASTKRRAFKDVNVHVGSSTTTTAKKPKISAADSSDIKMIQSILGDIRDPTIRAALEKIIKDTSVRPTASPPLPPSTAAPAWHTAICPQTHKPNYWNANLEPAKEEAREAIHSAAVEKMLKAPKKGEATPKSLTDKMVNSELSLQQQLIREVDKRLPYTNLFAQEWEVLRGCSHLGKGDLVFKRPGFQEYLVVEVKYLRPGSGRAARNKRNAARRKVVEQALRYGAAFKRRHPDADVEIATYTNESGLCLLAYYNQTSHQLHYHLNLDGRGILDAL